MRNVIRIGLITAAVSVFGAGFAAAQTASVQVIHNSPDPLAEMVDIYINEDLALDNFAFRAATPVLDLPAGVELVIGVAGSESNSSDDAIATFPVTLTEGESYLVMATGVLDGSLPGNPDGIDTAFNLEIFVPLTTTAPAGEVALLAYHGAPDAPTVDVVAVNVGVLVDDLAYTDFQGYLNVPAADYTLQVTPGDDNGNVLVAYQAPLADLGGAGAVVFASGFFTAKDGHLPSFGLFAALPNGDVVELPLAPVANEASSWSGVKNAYR